MRVSQRSRRGARAAEGGREAAVPVRRARHDARAAPAVHSRLLHARERAAARQRTRDLRRDARRTHSRPLLFFAFFRQQIPSERSKKKLVYNTHI